jgi:hypothetical protein
MQGERVKRQMCNGRPEMSTVHVIDDMPPWLQVALDLDKPVQLPYAKLSAPHSFLPCRPRKHEHSYKLSYYYYYYSTHLVSHY